jgi:two-component system, cell cycle sensor histidine kinase and response regulator CckA
MNESIRILFVEDEATDAELAQREIRKGLEFCTFHRVETREEYLTALTEFQPDLIISDYRMPRFDGLNAVKLALEKTPFTPVIILTGALNEDTAVECMKTGAVDYVIKEHIKRLSQAVMRALEQKRVREERYQAEQAIRESEARYRSLIHTLPDAMTVVDLNGNITFLAPYAIKFYGFSNGEELVGRSIMEWIHRDYHAKVQAAMQAALSGETIRNEEFLLFKEDGSTFYGDISASCMRNAQGQAAGFLILVRDISDRKRTEEERQQLQAQLQQAQKMESIGRLAGGVAHDFNNMLSVILGYTELLQSQLPAHDPMLSDLAQIEKAGKHAKDITQQLLAFSRKQIIEPMLLDLNEVVTSVQKGLVRLIGEDIELSFHPQPNLHKIKFDRSQCEQILINLAVNARDAMPRHGGRLVIETANYHLDSDLCRDRLGFSPGDYVLLTVSDNGAGMDELTLSHAFEPFFTTKAVGKGTGLGLAMVYGIVNQGGGGIEAHSEPGHGATFKIYFPRTEEIETLAPETRESPIEPGTGTILVVEDDGMVRDMTVAMLEAMEYRVFAAATPMAALEYCEKCDTAIDLLVTDVVMPELSGAELRDRLLKLRPEIKVLFISGYAGDIIAHHGILNEGTHFVQKPFSRNDLAAAVRNVMLQGS